ncbi:MAG: proton-conducting membrane transporter [Acidimicrobiales bacterium]|nr:proton-conducting membrane transporter [Acidimicrobiales bacterium]
MDIRPSQLPRLLLGATEDQGQVSLEEHLEIWGPLVKIGKSKRDEFLNVLEASGLRGHGGAWFPVAAKWRSVRQSTGLKSAVVVDNGSEGEPASEKDRLLLSKYPHLVLDGLSLATSTLNASKVYLCLHDDLADGLAREIRKRQRQKLGDPDIEVVPIVDTYLAGEESALVNYLNGGALGVPLFKGQHPVRERGVKSRPTLVQNVETLAHVGAVARLGAHNFRALGTKTMPGSALITVSGAVKSSGVVEVALGSPIKDVLVKAGGATSNIGGILLGGYGGNWLMSDKSSELPLAEDILHQAGLTMGASIIGVLPEGICPLGVTGAILKYLVNVRARQCGPCEFGLPALSNSFDLLVNGVSGKNIVAELTGWCDMVEKRGACHHPDGAARLVRSALHVFRDDVGRHLRQGGCSRPFGPFPFALPKIGTIQIRRSGLEGAAIDPIIATKVRLNQPRYVSTRR